VTTETVADQSTGIDEESIGSLPGGASFGVLARGGARDPRSSYSSVGRRGKPRAAVDDGDDDATGVDRPFSFDISNNLILAAVDEEGFLRAAAISSGLVPVYETGLPGVFVNKDHDYVEGRFGVQIRAQGEALTSADLIDNLVPRAVAVQGQLRISRAAFAPQPTDASQIAHQGVLLITEVTNEGKDSAEIGWDVVQQVSRSHGPAAVDVRSLEAAEGESEGSFVLCAGATWTHVLSVVLTRGNADAVHEELAAKPARARLFETLAGLRARYGRLSIPDAPYYADLLERQGELARQVMLLDTEGVHAGSFWGSDANERPDVWMLDLYYSALPLAQLNPSLCRATIDFFVRYAVPPAAWGNHAAMDEGHPLPGVDPVSHSVANSTGAIALAGAYLQATGDLRSLIEDPAFLEHATGVIELLLKSRQDGDILFPSVFISDGPARGDFHTGTNIKAGSALRTMARILASVPGEEERAESWRAEAERVESAVRDRCRGESRFGTEYFEGVWRDGSYVLGHDGEESDLTLASFYGFTGRDDQLVSNHALSAFSTDNPYFVPEYGGVSWWDFRWHGPTFPAFIHALSVARGETDSLQALEEIRRRTDLDGSIWWWPHLHEETDPHQVMRGPGKCGWAAGVLVSKFISDLLGLRGDAVDRSLMFAPFIPWSSFTWEDARLGELRFDAHYSSEQTSVRAGIRNLGDNELTVALELLVPEGASVASFMLDGEDVREIVRARSRFGGRTAVIVEKVVRPGQSTELTLELRPFDAVFGASSP
jgi:hypothetical protein